MRPTSDSRLAGTAKGPSCVWLIVLVLVLFVILAILVARLVAAQPEPAPVGGAEDEPRSEEPPPFPYLHLDLPSPAEMFENLKNTDPPPKHGKKPALVARKWPADLYKCDGISNHFTEKVRAKCTFGDYLSPQAAWENPAIRARVEKDARKYPRLSPGDALREGLYSHSRWCNFYNAAFCLWVYRELARRLHMDPKEIRILDPSSGWGDRLISACAFEAKLYQGFDPNEELQEPYKKIIEEFAPKSGKSTYNVHCGPFEKDAPWVLKAESFDLVHTSPPFFSLERYPGDGDKHAVELPEYEAWLTKFYEPYLKQAWRALRPGGFLCLYITDIRDAPLEKDSKRVIKELGGQYEGSYGFRQVLDWPEAGVKKIKNGPVRPAHVWKKKASSQHAERAKARKSAVTGDLIVDTLNLAHSLFEGGRIGQGKTHMDFGVIEEAIRLSAPKLKDYVRSKSESTGGGGKVYYVLKDRDSGSLSPKTQTRLALLAKELKVSVHIALASRETRPDWQQLGEDEPTHQKQGRDDFYLGYLAWKLRSPVLTEDRMRDFAKLKTEVQPFTVWSFDWWKNETEVGQGPVGSTIRIFPGASEYAKMRAPTQIRFGEVGLD